MFNINTISLIASLITAFVALVTVFKSIRNTRRKYYNDFVTKHISKNDYEIQFNVISTIDYSEQKTKDLRQALERLKNIELKYHHELSGELIEFNESLDKYRKELIALDTLLKEEKIKLETNH